MDLSRVVQAGARPSLSVPSAADSIALAEDDLVQHIQELHAASFLRRERMPLTPQTAIGLGVRISGKRELFLRVERERMLLGGFNRQQVVSRRDGVKLGSKDGAGRTHDRQPRFGGFVRAE